MSKFRVVITDHVFPNTDIEQELLQSIGAELAVHQCRTEEEVIAATKGADAVLVCFAPMGEKAVRSLDKAKIIARYGIGVDNVAVDAATEKGIIVTNVPDYCINEVADHAVALMLALARQVVNLHDNVVNKKSWDYKPFRPLFRLEGQTLGLLGFGRIARAVMERAKGFGMKIIAFDPYVDAAAVEAAGARKVELDELLETADFISVHTPLTPETRGLLGEKAFKKMKRTAFIINTSRGGIIDEEALYRALVDGEIRGAALDVLEKEGDVTTPLVNAPNVILTPHVAFYSEEAVKDLQRKAAQEVVRVLTGEKPVNVVNRSVLSGRQ